MFMYGACFGKADRGVCHRSRAGLPQIILSRNLPNIRDVAVFSNIGTGFFCAASGSLDVLPLQISGRFLKPGFEKNGTAFVCIKAQINKRRLCIWITFAERKSGIN